MNETPDNLEYAVIICRSQEEITATIGRCFARGWRLQGGVSIATRPILFFGIAFYSDILLAQALVREKPE